MSLDMLAILLSFSCLAIFVLSISPQSTSGLYFGHDLSVINHIQNSSLSPRQITATENGDVYVVWVDKNNIYITSGHKNESKFGPQLLLNHDSKVVSSPQITATEKGDVYVVWVDINNVTGHSNIQFIGSNDGGKTFSPRKELKGGDTISFSPQITATEKGDVYVVWVDKSSKTGDTDITFRSSHDGGKTFSPRTELRRGDTISFSPQITATEKGDVYVVWVDKSSKTGDTDITFRSSHDNGTIFDNRKKLRSNNLLSISPQITATESGEVYIVWTDKNGTTADSQISFRSSRDSGSNFDRIINLNKNENNLSISSSPQVATTGNSVYVVWVDKHIQFKEILVNDAIVGIPISLSSKTTTSLSPQITATDKGDIYVLWIDKNNSTDRSLHLKRIGEYFIDRNP